jgi:5-methyltetrahydrofolate--homocysteine methyltransferase
MGKVGDLFEKGDFFLPEMLISARAIKSGLSILKPWLKGTNIPTSEKIVIGTVKGYLHDIGKNLVAIMLEWRGFEVHDLGADESPEKFWEAVREHTADIVGMSALRTTTLGSMKSTIEALEDLEVRENIKVIIGGALVTEAYAKEIEADGFAPDASRGVSHVKSLIAVS